MSEKNLTIIVPAKPDSFNKRNKHWQAIKLAKVNWDKIKYIAIYESGKIAQITHYAEVKSIVRLPKNPDEKTPKCRVNICDSWKAVKCEKRQKGDIVVRSTRYTQFLDFHKQELLKYSQFFI